VRSSGRPPGEVERVRQFRRRALLLVLALTSFALLAASAGADAGTRATTMHLYVAFDAQGQLAPALRPLAKVSGHCWAGSIADSRADAWRCLSSAVVVRKRREFGKIFDPCFSPALTGAYVACPVPSEPWTNFVIVLRLTEPLSRKLAHPARDPTRGRPWAFVTASGRQCAALTGTVPIIAEVPLGYAYRRRRGGRSPSRGPRLDGALWSQPADEQVNRRESAGGLVVSRAG
jgi:hypothetical protein